MAILDSEVMLHVFGIDKIYHFLFYGLAAFLLGSIVCQLSPQSRSLTRILWVALALWIMGIVDEYRQFFDIERDTEFLDVMANLTGIAIGLLLPILRALRSKVGKEKWFNNKGSIIKGSIIKASKAYMPMFLVVMVLTYGLTFLTSKGPPTKFFPDQAEKASQEVFLTTQTNRGYAGLREKYLPQLMYLEKEYREELASLTLYAKANGHILQHAWRMKQLGDATEEQFESILTDMRREIEHNRLSNDILDRVEDEFWLRRNRQRAEILKEVFAQK